VSDGRMVPLKMQASHNQSASLQLMLHAVLGTTPTYSQAAPMVFSRNNAIASGASALTKLFTTGPVKFDSVLAQGIMDIAVDFGHKVDVESDSGDVYPSFVTTSSRKPKIMFTTKDQELIASIGDGVAISSLFTAYFRKVSQNNQRVAVGTAQHISVAGTKGVIVPGTYGMKHQTPGTTGFTFVPSKDTVIMTVSTSATIPTS